MKTGQPTQNRLQAEAPIESNESKTVVLARFMINSGIPFVAIGDATHKLVADITREQLETAADVVVEDAEEFGLRL